ncbi:hypothetical protein L7F22_065378 [Adiantum nelumboides]|nr:hypothetical protein [Adiantum nelumboides]
MQALVSLPSPKSAKELVSPFKSWSEENEQQFNEIKELLSSLPTIAPPRWEETFYVNPSVGSDSIGAVLMQKDGETSFMRPIYFVSRVMTPLEKDYTMIEKMVMALMFAVERFRSYLLRNKFVILTVEDTFPLVLQHMDVSASISKWLVRLQEFKYIVQVESSTRANLAGMLTHRCYERKVKVKAPRPEPVEVQAKLCGAHSLYFDGAYKRKVDKASVGISIQDEDGQKVFGKALLVETPHSNNEAEYAALALGLEWCVGMGIKRLNVFGDALLLIKQVSLAFERLMFDLLLSRPDLVVAVGSFAAAGIAISMRVDASMMLSGALQTLQGCLRDLHTGSMVDLHARLEPMLLKDMPGIHHQETWEPGICHQEPWKVTKGYKRILVSRKPQESLKGKRIKNPGVQEEDAKNTQSRNLGGDQGLHENLGVQEEEAKKIPPGNLKDDQILGRDVGTSRFRKQSKLPKEAIDPQELTKRTRDPITTRARTLTVKEC